MVLYFSFSTTNSVRESHVSSGRLVDWSPASFTPSINFSQNKRGVHQFPDLMIDQIPSGLPLKMTPRIVLEQTMQNYDPFGILSPFTLPKELTRLTWISDF